VFPIFHVTRFSATVMSTYVKRARPPVLQESRLQ
jgi:hypothetical protein